MCPLPATTVIHPDWSTRHRPVAEGTMTATATVTRAGTGDGSYNPATGQTDPPAATTVGAGLVCRVQARDASERVELVGDQPVTLRTYLVAFEATAPAIRIDDRVAFTAAKDAGLVGRSLRVRDVLFGSETWQRDTICEDDLG